MRNAWHPAKSRAKLTTSRIKRMNAPANSGRERLKRDQASRVHVSLPHTHRPPTSINIESGSICIPQNLLHNLRKFLIRHTSTIDLDWRQFRTNPNLQSPDCPWINALAFALFVKAKVSQRNPALIAEATQGENLHQRPSTSTSSPKTPSPSPASNPPIHES